MKLTDKIVQANTTKAAATLDANDKGHGMTIAELAAFVTNCNAAGVPADARIMVRVNIGAGIKTIWTK